jgi:hypothetical protein
LLNQPEHVRETQKLVPEITLGPVLKMALGLDLETGLILELKMEHGLDLDQRSAKEMVNISQTIKNESGAGSSQGIIFLIVPR